MLSLTQALVIAIASGVVTGAITWGGILVHLKYLRRDVDRAHRRLDAMGAPGAWRSS